MIERRRCPGRCTVAGGAVVVKVIGHVIRISDALESRLMAGVAVRRCADVSRRVTCYTGGNGMRAGQWERRVVMAKTGWFPSDSCVTLRANVIEIRQHMVGVGNALVVCLVAGPAIAWPTGVDVHSPNNMALITIYTGMTSGQRKSG
jgi:hypothetical protein